MFLFFFTEQIFLVPFFFFFLNQHLGRLPVPGSINRDSPPDIAFILIGQRKVDGSLTDKGLFGDFYIGSAMH